MADRFGCRTADDVRLKIPKNSILDAVNKPVYGQLAAVAPGVAQ
jgi:hypothetical protein